MSEKITASHLEREAYVYVRQSSMEQVRHNLESQRRQYGLAERARQMGFHQVVVIDEDLGRSGGGSQQRPGFGRLLGSVCAGRAGAVFALEASRLARNNRDWHHLIDLCALTATLVVDHDGIYDPRLLNDRLLLGLKGTMSEFELGLLRQRAHEALRQAIGRGEVLFELPVGYIRTKDRRCEMTPDRQVQEAIRGLFTKFRESGSARQVLLWYRQERVSLPSLKRGSGGSEVEWQLPVYNRIISILKNPTYAGAYVYGRRRTRTVVVEGRAHKSSGHEVPRKEWEVLIRDHHARYIGWEEYLQNQEKLEANCGMHGVMKGGAAKKGAALLAGLLRCGRCGRKFHVAYAGRGGRELRYHCRGANINHGAGRCVSFGGRRADEAVAKAVLDAVRPAGVEASLAAWDEMARHDSEKQRALQLAADRARYESERARRQYDAVEPENRLVAAELESRWNEQLERLGELESQLADLVTERVVLDEGTRRRLLELGRDLEEAWNHPAAPVELKKRILRTVLEEIVVDLRDDPARTVLWLHWSGGVHTRLDVPRNRTGEHGRCTDRQVVELVRELAQVCPDCNTARILNRLGYRTGAGNVWTELRVTSMRSHHKIAAFDATRQRDWVTMNEAATLLGVSDNFVRKLLKRGILPGRQLVMYAPWMIRREDLSLPQVRRAADTLRSERRRSSRGATESGVSLFSST